MLHAFGHLTRNVGRPSEMACACSSSSWPALGQPTTTVFSPASCIARSIVIACAARCYDVPHALGTQAWRTSQASSCGRWLDTICLNRPRDA